MKIFISSSHDTHVMRVSQTVEHSKQNAVNCSEKQKFPTILGVHSEYES